MSESALYKQPPHIKSIYLFHGFDFDSFGTEGKWASNAAHAKLNIYLVRVLATTKEAKKRAEKTIECLKTGRAFDAA